MSHILKVNKAHIDLFRQDLYKDIRKLEADLNGPVKIFRRYDDGVTSIPQEVDFLNFINKNKSSWKTPAIINSNEQYIEFEYLSGIRLFNFIIELRYMHFIEKSLKAQVLTERIKKILLESLKDFQKISKGYCINKEDDYPFMEKMSNPIKLLCDVFSFNYNESEIQKDLEQISLIVSQNSGTLFRDATTKNAILFIEDLYFTNFKDDAERRIVLRDMVENDFFSDEKLIDSIYQFDFSGCQFKCPEIDDEIAIHLHECTAWTPTSKEFYINHFSSPEFLCTLFVRYLRFGGRKLAYRLLNKEGHKIRFRFDYEKHYFLELIKIANELSRLEIIKGSELVRVFYFLSSLCNFLPEKDYLTEFYDTSKTPYYSGTFPEQ